MGYRSDVKMTITVDTKKESLEKLVKELHDLTYLEKDINETRKFFYNDDEFNYCVKVLKDKGVIRIKFDDIKWYSSYGSIQAFEKWKNSLVDRGHDYHFIRLGEDWEDVEEEYEDVNIGLKETIQFTRALDFE